MPVTQVLTFQVFDDTGLLPGVVRAATVSGTCSTASTALAGRADAWRCTGGGTTYDPCFSTEALSELACLADPFGHDATIVRIPGVPPRGRNDPARPPWFLELDDGSRCGPGAAVGPTTPPATYPCANGTTVYGDVDRSRPAWTARVGPTGASGVRTAAVRIAWY